MSTPTDPQRMEKIVSLCKRRGFIFQAGEIYGGLNGVWDYGPLGVELKRNLKDYWWRVMVREFDPPYRFVDVQLWGPFARWEHRHRFVAGPPDEGEPGIEGTWVKDRLTYRLPLGRLGNLAHALAAGRQITSLFDHRDRRLLELLS